MNELTVKILSTDTIAPELNRTIDALSTAAYSDDHEAPDDVRWDSHIAWMALGFLEEQLVTVLCLLEREIRVGEAPVRVAGIGGVATHPSWQRRGFVTQLLQTTHRFMREQMGVPFGLLVCAQGTRPVYARSGWQHVADSLVFHQDGQRRVLDTAVMILPLADQSWPAGEIDLLGPPW